MTYRVTQDEMQSILNVVRDNQSFSIKIFCDLHYIYDSNNEPTDKTFYGAIINVYEKNKLIGVYSISQVRDKKFIKPYRTWQTLIGSFLWETRCSVEFREYQVDAEYMPN